MSVLRAAASAVNLSELLPAPTAGQVRRNLRIGIVLRWITIALVAAGGMLTPKLGTFLLYLVVAATIYNGGVTALVARAPAAWDRRLALTVTIIDTMFGFIFPGLYATQIAGSEPLGAYVFGLIEAVFYFGAVGAILSIGLFVVCALTVKVFGLPLFGQLFDGGGLVNSVLLLGMIAVCLVVTFRLRIADQTETATPETARPAALEGGEPAVRLSRREREVLSLVAEGYSNTMIATRLHLSDSTVKGYVENLLFHLNARNRAEAVAAASRLKLL
ncbi:MAG TPA: helix-turn-helix transcriptional regulator [Candidatus Acidoferrum sp.]|nr:helix-turn-helix transcriptional regulator [Candidatus Acidoferrum sp.]